MITVEVDPDTNTAILKPEGRLTQSDFETVRGVVDPYVDQTGKLDGVIVYARKFPGRESFKDLSSQLRFSQDQHEKVPRVALVSDTALPGVEEALGEHFSGAQIKTFAFQDLDQAKRWITEAEEQ